MAGIPHNRRRMRVARDSKNFTAVCDNAEEPTEKEKVAARRTICANATSVEDAAMLLQMLGLFPGQEAEGYNLPPGKAFT